MDILIKGLEMPKTCRRCMEMEIPIRCRVMKEEPATAVMSGYERPSDCPLIEVKEADIWYVNKKMWVEASNGSDN